MDAYTKHKIKLRRKIKWTYRWYQYHNKKRETIYVLEGKLLIYIGNNENNLEKKIFSKNQSITIEPKIIHRMEALEDSVYLESSTPELNDVVRIQDDYSRK